MLTQIATYPARQGEVIITPHSHSQPANCQPKSQKFNSQASGVEQDEIWVPSKTASQPPLCHCASERVGHKFFVSVVQKFSGPLQKNGFKQWSKQSHTDSVAAFARLSAS